MLSIDQILSGSSSLRGRGDLLVEVVVVLGEGAVNVEPPVADEVLLVEEGSVGAEEAVLDEVVVTKVGADVECLALSFGVSIVTLKNQTMNIDCLNYIYMTFMPFMAFLPYMVFFIMAFMSYMAFKKCCTSM